MASKHRPIEWKIKWEPKRKSKIKQKEINKTINNVFKYFESSLVSELRGQWVYGSRNVKSYLITEEDAITWDIYQEDKPPMPERFNGDENAYDLVISIIDNAVSKMKRFQLENFYYLRKLAHIFGDVKLNLFYLFDETTGIEYGHVYFFTNEESNLMVIVALKFSKVVSNMRGWFYKLINPYQFHIRFWNVLFSQTVQFLEFETSDAIIVSPLSVEREISYFKYFNQIRNNQDQRIFEYNSYGNLLVCDFDKFWSDFWGQKRSRGKMLPFQPYQISHSQLKIEVYEEDDDDVEMEDKEFKIPTKVIKKKKPKVTLPQFDDDGDIDMDRDEEPVKKRKKVDDSYDEDVMDWEPTKTNYLEDEQFWKDQKDLHDAIKKFMGSEYFMGGVWLSNEEILRLYRGMTQVKQYDTTPGMQRRKTVSFIHSEKEGGFKNALKLCLNGQGTKINKRTFDEILNKASGVFELQKCDIETVEIRSKAYIIGDLHGSVLDLKKILISTGLISRDGNRVKSKTSEKYIFLGDYVDRGKYSFSTSLAVFLLKILFPHNVYVLAGNHERPMVPVKGKNGLEYEMKNSDQYKEQMELYVKRIKRAFQMLKIGLLINFENKFRVFCSHASIPNDKKIPLGCIKYKMTSDRGAGKYDFLNVYTPEQRSKYRLLHSKLGKKKEKFYQKYYYRIEGRSGFVKDTGEKMFRDFFKKNDVDLFIRGHEPQYEIIKNGKNIMPVRKDGYYLHSHHSYKILTIHSVYNYQGSRDPGGFVEINPKEEGFHIHQIHKDKVKKGVMNIRYKSIPKDYVFREVDGNGVINV